MKNLIRVPIVGLGLIGAVLIILVLAAVPALLGGLIGWLLWNHALASLFHGPQLGYWQVVGIFWLMGVVSALFRTVFK